MVVEMGSDRIRCHIVGRTLNRCKLVNLMSHWKYDDPPRMLSGSSSNTGTSLYNTVDFANTFMLTTFFIIIFYISKGCFISQCTNGTGTESLSRTKNNFCITVGLTLIVPREVQVDIRFFVSLKSKECFERNIKSFFCQRLSAHRTISILHVTSNLTGIGFYNIRIKIYKVTGWTNIVRGQRIYFCNPRHGCYKGGTYRTPRTNQVTIRIGFPYQFLGNDIHYGETVADDGF